MHGFLLLWHKVSLEKSLAAVSTDYFFAPKKRGQELEAKKGRKKGYKEGMLERKGVREKGRHRSITKLRRQWKSRN